MLFITVCYGCWNESVVNVAAGSFPELSWFAIGPWDSECAVQMPSRVVLTSFVPAKLSIMCNKGSVVVLLNP